MPNFPRLSHRVAVPRSVQDAVKYLETHEGLCICGRYLNATDAKRCLAFADGVGSFTIAAYCYSCFLSINDVLKGLVNRLAHPEPDRRRHESGA